MCWCYFSFLKMYSEKFLMLAFVSKCFLNSFWQRETQLSIFWKILEQLHFHEQTSKFLVGHCFNILINFSFFQRNENRFINLVLKAKQQKAIQLSYIFLKFYINQSSNTFLLFLHFWSLWNLSSFMQRLVSMLFFLCLTWKWFSI